MRKILLLFVALVFNATLIAQVVIPMEKDGGVYKVPCVVNGLRMKFIFDTGAATVCISENMANYMLENDYLSKSDIGGIGQSSVADGRIVDHVKITLRKIEIGGKVITDVPAVVIVGQTAPLLLGQSALEKIGKISINGGNLIITDGSLTNKEALKEKAQRAQNLGDYLSAATYWEEYYDVAYIGGKPSETDDYCVIADCYFWAKDWERALKWYEKVLYQEAQIISDVNIALVNLRVGDCCFNLSKYERARTSYHTASDEYMKKNDSENFAAALYAESSANHNLGDYYEAQKNVYLAICFYVQYKYPSIMKNYDSLKPNESFVVYMTRYTFPVDKTLSNYVLRYIHEEVILRMNPLCEVYKLAARLGSDEAIREYKEFQIKHICQ